MDSADYNLTVCQRMDNSELEDLLVPDTDVLHADSIWS